MPSSPTRKQPTQPHSHDRGHSHDHHHHSHEHEHHHEHDHEHGHEHHHDHHAEDSEGTELSVKKTRWELVDRFKASRGREPTGDELRQLLEHGHTHDHMEDAGSFHSRDRMRQRFYDERAFTVGVGGPVGSGKTALMLELCKQLRGQLSLGAVTNDIFTREDGEFLVKHKALPEERIRAIETGGCPHAAIREDISANLQACEELTAAVDADLILVESGGDNLAANFSRELADFIIYVIDVSGGDKIPRKGGPGITQADLLVVNKIDLAAAVGADLEVMKRDAKKMRADGPTVFAQVKAGVGVEEIVKHVMTSYRAATSEKKQKTE